MSYRINIGIVDDHQLVLDGLNKLLTDQVHIKIKFATANPTDVHSLIKHNPIDVLLTDIIMPQMSGKDLALSVTTNYPNVKIIALSMDNDPYLVSDLIENANLSGYLLKNIDKSTLIKAIEQVYNGEIFYSEEVVDALERAKFSRHKVEDAKLTQRELEIIRLIEKEKSNKQIAEELFISERTVETHRKNIFRKTNTNSTLGIVKYAYEHKLI